MILDTEDLIFRKSYYRYLAIAWILDALELAYAGVVYMLYICGIDSERVTHLSLGIAKTKLATIKCMTATGVMWSANCSRLFKHVRHPPQQSEKMCFRGPTAK